MNGAGAPGRGGRADDQVVDAVALHIARITDRAARVLTGVDASEHEAGAAVPAALRQEASQVQNRRESGRAPEHDAAPAEGIWNQTICRHTDDHVIDTIAVHVARAADYAA